MFLELDAMRHDEPIDLYVYASHNDAKVGGAKVSQSGALHPRLSALLGGSHCNRVAQATTAE